MRGVVALALWCCGVVLWVGGCSPLKTFPDSGALCDQDDDCELGAICRASQCLHIEGGRPSEIPILPEDGGTPDALNVKEGSCDAGNERPCFHGKGAPVGRCKAGIQQCQQGRWSLCIGEQLPQQELCNGEDDDCDGQIDNQPKTKQPLQRSCRGACGPGIEQCLRGEWADCNAPKPEVEVCNGKDDDCDGQIDNRLSAPLCRKQLGVCFGARQRCDGAKGWVDCSDADYAKHSGGTYELQENRCDNLDNDCDGIIDPTPPCICRKGDQRTCYPGPNNTAGVGICKAGIQICQEARWGPCEGVQLPQTEECNGKDDDCDGQIDNRPQTQAPLEQPCSSACGAGVKQCLQGQWSSCNAPTPQLEVCNGKDDDCDGQIDNQPQSTQAIQRACFSPCGAGSEHCIAGQWMGCTAPPPKTEECNGFDDDCDGQIDEHLNRPCTGTCQEGTETCVNGFWKGCQTRSPTSEVCDGKDNDCDGQVDENCAKFKTYSSLQGDGFLPVLDPSGQYAAILSYQGKAQLIRLKDGVSVWSHPSSSSSNEMVGGIAISAKSVKFPQTPQPAVAIAGIENGTSKLSLYALQDQQKLLQQLTWGPLTTLGDILFGLSDATLFALEPGNPALMQLDFATSTGGNLQLQPTTLSLKNVASSTTCAPGRISRNGSELLVTCAGFSWFPSPQSQLQPLPSISVQLQGFPDPPGLALFSTSGSSSTPPLLKFKKWFPSFAYPVDVTWTPFGFKHLIFMSLFHEKPTLPNQPLGSIQLFAWSSSISLLKTLAVPAPPGRLARPVGIRATYDGYLFVAIQEFENTPPYRPKGGRIAKLTLTQFLAGIWFERQTIPLTNPPVFLEMTSNGKTLVVACPQNGSFDLVVIDR